jgi:hypothetical protein
MKRTVLLVLAISVVMSLGGCGPSTSTEPWAAWAFDDLVVPVSGGSGKVATFAIQGTRSDNTATRRFNIEGSYLGKGTTDIQIRRTERSLAYPYAVTETIVTVPVECYQLEHKVTVLQDTTGAVHPAWAEMTLWIPTVQRSVGPVGEDTCGDSSAWTSFVCRAEYADADGRTAKWSWFQTGEMAAEEGEKQGKWLWYCPIVEGEFDYYLWHAPCAVYSGAEYWFANNPSLFKEGTRRSGYHGTTVWTGTRTKATVGNYRFSGWTLDRSCGYGGLPCDTQTGCFVHDLPVPVSLELRGEGSTYEFTLTALLLR